MITAMMMLFRFNIVNIFRLSCVYLRALPAEGLGLDGGWGLRAGSRRRGLGGAVFSSGWGWGSLK